MPWKRSAPLKIALMEEEDRAVPFLIAITADYVPSAPRATLPSIADRHLAKKIRVGDSGWVKVRCAQTASTSYASG